MSPSDFNSLRMCLGCIFFGLSVILIVIGHTIDTRLDKIIEMLKKEKEKDG